MRKKTSYLDSCILLKYFYHICSFLSCIETKSVYGIKYNLFSGKYLPTYYGYSTNSRPQINKRSFIICF